jgi:type IV pilus assembly protein PilW
MLNRRRAVSAHGGLLQRGLSLVELLVGIAIGMFIVAAATMIVVTQLGDNRRLLVETQVQQDLRAAADIITRDLRRAGALRLTDAHSGLASPTVAAVDSIYMPVAPIGGGPATQVDFLYMRTATDLGPYGFRLTDGAIESLQAGGNWQQLTDRSTLEITAFSVTPRHEPMLRLPCQRLCTDGTQDCWPELRVRRYTITITGRAVADRTVQRTVTTSLRLRNDDVDFKAAQVCP